MRLQEISTVVHKLIMTCASVGPRGSLHLSSLNIQSCLAIVTSEAAVVVDQQIEPTLCLRPIVISI